MGGPEKPFSCPESGCGASFTNEDRLAVHSRKHDMVLQLGSKGGTFVADQTPTPTRFIRNCEEVGLFQDLQNVNPFDETFKRAMESRIENNQLTLNSHLSAPSADDTLHTPHIFPHIHDDNSNNQYHCKADQHSNQTPVEKQLSADDDIKKETMDKSLLIECEDCVRQKPIKYSRLKFIRQRSVEIIENDHNPIILEKIDASSIGCGKLHDGMTLINNDKYNKLKEKCEKFARINIPIINVTDSSEKSASNEDPHAIDNRNTIAKNDKCNKSSILLNTPDLERINMKILNKKSLELMSQTSIDMALVNFTNEVNDRTMDLNNISIEDIPTLNAVNENASSSDKQNLIESIDNTENDSPYSVSKNNILIINEYKKNDETNLLQEKLDNSDTDNATNHSSPLNRTDTTSYDDNKNTDNNDNKGYELLLKWPDGKKVYLKEVFREDDVQKESASALNNDKQDLSECNIKENTFSISGVKRKLKESLESGAKRNQNATSPINAKIKIPAVYNPNVLSNDLIIPHTYIVQKTNELPYISNCSLVKSREHLLNENATMRQSPIKIQPKTSSQNLVLSLGPIKSTNDPKKNSAIPILMPKLNINMQNVSNTNLSEPILNRNSNNLAISNEKATKPNNQSTKSTNKPTLKTNKNIAKQNDSKLYDQKKVEILERNRAAVTRYRTRKMEQNNLMCQKNKKLELENSELTKKLSLAVQEIKRLREILSAHSNCSIDKNF